MRGARYLLAAGAVSAALLVSTAARAGDPLLPHEHKGVLKPFAARPPLVVTDADTQTLHARGIVRQPFSATDARALLVFEVNAPPDIVWAVITDLKAMPSYVEEIKAVDVLTKSGDHTVAKLALGQMGVSLEEFVDYDFHNSARQGTWTLDYSKRSDIDDSVGFWRVTPSSTNGASIVEYAAEVRAMAWMPGFFQSVINDKALAATPGWVRDFSARRAAARAAMSPATPSASE